MIIITGAAGFIGSCMARKLNLEGHQDLILVDDFTRPEKAANWRDKQYEDKIHRNNFFLWAEQNHRHIDCIIHLGARTDTTEMDYSIFEELNVGYTQQMWRFAAQYRIPMLYASSAATYGGGENGYLDDERLIPSLQPLNPYGKSKNEIDKWILKQSVMPPLWAGFKFFNVYGPNEYHKGRMASVIFHAFNQIAESGRVKLFKSHREDYADGQQLRDFIYVMDVVDTLYQFARNSHPNGIYNLGTGKARSFYDLATATFRALGKEPVIDFIDMPEDIRDKYQYFTEANVQKLKNTRLKTDFYTIEEGTKDYVSTFLNKKQIF